MLLHGGTSLAFSQVADTFVQSNMCINVTLVSLKPV